MYNITIKNNTSNTILLNDGKTTKNIYLTDKDDVKYTALINEIPINTLTIAPQRTKTLNLKFNKTYNANTTIKNIQIKNIYLNKEKYDLNSNDESLEKLNISIDL